MLGEPLTLALAHRAGQIDDGVALHRLTRRPQGAQQLLGERSRAGTELPQFVRTARFQGLCDLPRERRAEQRRQLRGGDEIAARLRQRAELAAVVRVVAQARCVQRHRHEAVERQPAPRGVDLAAQQCGEQAARRCRITGFDRSHHGSRACKPKRQSSAIPATREQFPTMECPAPNEATSPSRDCLMVALAELTIFVLAVLAVLAVAGSPDFPRAALFSCRSPA